MQGSQRLRWSLTRSLSHDITSEYIENWFASTVKRPEFYTFHATQSAQKNYFYAIDLQGRVFLEDVLPKNIATSLKDVKFLDFFYRRIRRVNVDEQQYLKDWGAQSDYPYISMCGKERNFIRPADCAIVFHSLLRAEKSSSCEQWQVAFGGSLLQPFKPDGLFTSKRSGRLYQKLCDENGEHRLPEVMKDAFRAPLLCRHKDFRSEYGLFKSSVAVALSENIILLEKQEADKCTKQSSGAIFVCPVTEKLYPIRTLPKVAEPGSWSMPC